MKTLLKRMLCAALTCGMAISAAGATDWGLWYGNGLNQPPNGEDTVQTLAQYGAYYMGEADEKVLYLTFDCGYENGNTAKILDTLKEHHVPGAFFVVGHYLDAAPELVKRMADEGHLVCNHSDNHPNMTTVGYDRFAGELTGLAAQYKALTGRTIAPFSVRRKARTPMTPCAGRSSWVITPRCGAWPTRTGTRKTSPPMQAQSRRSAAGCITAQSCCCTRSPRPTPRFWTT